MFMLFCPNKYLNLNLTMLKKYNFLQLSSFSSKALKPINKFVGIKPVFGHPEKPCKSKFS